MCTDHNQIYAYGLNAAGMVLCSGNIAVFSHQTGSKTVTVGVMVQASAVKTLHAQDNRASIQLTLIVKGDRQ